MTGKDESDIEPSYRVIWLSRGRLLHLAPLIEIRTCPFPCIRLQTFLALAFAHVDVLVAGLVNS